LQAGALAAVWQRYRGLIAGAAALAVCLVVLAVLYGGGDEEEPREPRAGAPPGFLGMVAEDAFARPGAYRSRSLDRVREAGAGLVRQTFDWTLIEHSPGRYYFPYYDRFVAALAERGLRLLPILFNPPPFRSSAPPRARRRGTYPPRRFADLGAFGAVLARRYGPGGSFWRSRPRLPQLPVRSWQIWNEPNVPVYWPPGPDAAAYARLLRVTGQAIKRVDPGAEIVTAGLAESELGVPLQSYLEGMYEAGAAGTFDVLALNPFAPDARGVLGVVHAARRVSAAHGDFTPVWITEFGWATGGPPSAFRVGEGEQADLIEETLVELASRRRELQLRGVIYFNWRDSLPYQGGRDFFGLHTGLLRRSGSAKPALDSYRRVAESLNASPG
jgi:polysaccharide biosynthesis protein PslG